VIGPTSSCDPAAASTGEFGHSRKTSSFVGRSGVNCTVTDPSTSEPATSTFASTSYSGRFGSGSASGPGSGQPAIGESGLAVVGVGVVVVVVSDADAAALDDAGAVDGFASLEQLTSTNAHIARSARHRITRWWHGYGRAVPSRTSTCVWRMTPALIVALDERFGEPTDAYVNGSQTWLRDDGPNGITLEWRLHPVASYQRPEGLDTYEVFSAIALALGTGGDAAAPPEALWDGLEVFAAYDDDDVEPAPLAAAAEVALGIEPDACGLVDHSAIGDKWEASRGAISIIDALLAEIRS